MKTLKEFDLEELIKHSDDKELAEGLKMITENEGLTFPQLESFFKKSASDFEAKLNYELARQAVIFDIFRYSNVAVGFALIMVTVAIHIVNLATIGEPISYDFENGRMFYPY